MLNRCGHWGVNTCVRTCSLSWVELSRHFHCLLQAWLLQLSLSQPAQVSDHLAPTDPELSCTCCCQSSQIQSHHSHPSVSVLAKIQSALKYKLLSLTYKVLTTTQPSYLHNLITVQPPRSARYSSLVTLARPSTSSLRLPKELYAYIMPFQRSGVT